MGMIVVLLGIVYVPMYLGGIYYVIHKGPQIVDNHFRNILLSKDANTKGDPNATYTLVEFADYQCSHCKIAGERLEVLLKTLNKPIRLMFRNYPLPNHNHAKEAAYAAEAAGEQGKFWEMHDYIFSHQKELDKLDFDPARFDEYADELGLNVEQFRRDRTDSRIIQRRWKPVGYEIFCSFKMEVFIWVGVEFCNRRHH